MALPLYSSTSVSANKSHHTVIKASKNKVSKGFPEDIEIAEELEESEFEQLFVPFVFSFYLQLNSINQRQVATFNLNYAIASANACPRYLRINRLTI
jgi:hypothetical protein